MPSTSRISGSARSRLDALHVDAEHLETVAKQPNLPSGLKDYLADVYTRRAPHAAGARTGGP